jgi:hypothetical protein
MKTKLLIIMLLIVNVMQSCSEKQNSAKNYYNQWIKGKGYSINAVFVSDGSLYLQIRNSSNSTLPITPISAVGWFKKAGKQTSDFTFGNFGYIDEGTTIKSITLAVTMSDGQTYEIKSDAQHPEMKIRPEEEVSFQHNFWQRDKINRNYPAKKLLITIGRDGSSQQEAFLIYMKKEK